MNIEKDMEVINKVMHEGMEETDFTLYSEAKRKYCRERTIALQTALKYMKIVKGLPSEEEIREILGQCYTTKENEFKEMDATLMNTIAKALHKRIRGEK